MSPSKQKIFLDLLAKDKYRLETTSGRILSYRRKINSWEPVMGNLLPSGYRQYILRDGKEKVVIYGHVATWLASYGEYDETIAIKHKNDDRSDNRRLNLFLDIEETAEVKVKYLPRMIRKLELEAIRKLMEAGKNATDISKALVLNRSSVAVTMKKIKEGHSFRFEDIQTRFEKKVDDYNKKQTCPIYNLEKLKEENG